MREDTNFKGSDLSCLLFITYSMQGHLGLGTYMQPVVAVVHALFLRCSFSAVPSPHFSSASAAYGNTKPRKNTTIIGNFFKKTNSVSVELIFKHPRVFFCVETTVKTKDFCENSAFFKPNFVKIMRDACCLQYVTDF